MVETTSALGRVDKACWNYRRKLEGRDNEDLASCKMLKTMHGAYTNYSSNVV